MKALIVYESYFGNTKTIAEAIEAGLNDRGVTTQLANATEAPTAIDADILIVGAPTHNRRLPDAASRDKAIEVGGAVCSQGVGEWLEQVSFSDVPYLASYDTATGTSWLTGSAAKHIAKILHKRHPKTTVKTKSFLVTGNEGPLEKDELTTARTWGRLIAADAKQ